MAPNILRVLQCLRRPAHLFELHFVKNQLFTSSSLSVINPLVHEHLRLQNSALYSQNVSGIEADERDKRKKSSSYVKITLLESNGNLRIISLEEADKIAKRRDFKLVKIVDKESKSERPLYKMMTKAQALEEDLAQRKIKKEKKQSDIKGEKLLSISDKIAKNDLESKIKSIGKWLSKKYEVRISINGSDEETSEQVFKNIESSVKECGKLVQKRTKGKDVKFSILPIIKKPQENAVENKPK